MIHHFILALQDSEHVHHDSSSEWLLSDDIRHHYELENMVDLTSCDPELLTEILHERFIQLTADRIRGRVTNREPRYHENHGVNGFALYDEYLWDVAEDALTGTKWEVEYTENILRIRFHEFIPAQPNTKHWIFLSYDCMDEYDGWSRQGRIPSHWMVEPSRKRIVAQAGVDSTSRTRRRCADCATVWNPNTEMFSCGRRGAQRPVKLCVGCTFYYHDFFDINTNVFQYIGQDFQALEFDYESLRLQLRRNIDRFELKEWLVSISGDMPFVPNTRYEDYSYELRWSFWSTNQRGETIAIPSDRYGNRIHQDRAHESKEYSKMGIPIGMELEVQYRDNTRNLETGIVDLLVPLHTEFPYGNERLRSTGNQLAIGTYDTSTGRHGLEFKFQPMSWEFFKQLPEPFFDSLTDKFRGYHAKRCGIHLNIPKSVLSSGQYWFFIAWHNMRLFDYLHGREDESPNMLGDIYQRVDVDYAKWVFLTDPSFEASNQSCGHRDHVDYDDAFKVACATSHYLANRRHSPQRNSWLNIENQARLEVRAFSSNTMKDRLIKNFQFLEALLFYADAVTHAYIPDEDYYAGVHEDIMQSFPGDYELDGAIMHLRDDRMFIKWLFMTGLNDVYTELISYLDRHGHIERALEMEVSSEQGTVLQEAVNWS